jgi:hypothetical protein
VIRELSTNAADSHVAVGKTDVPFEIHLPNELEPYFYVKDFGTGMSPESLEGIYSTFCDSNKTHSDEFTGCLGLGSKSPFSYTDNFFVESRWNGKVYVYSCFINEQGEPCLAAMGDFDTDEANGVKIEFAVKEKDFKAFIGKTASVGSWFKVRPTVVGAADFTFEDYVYLRKMDRYGVRKEKLGYSNVIMGNVAYPIRAEDFSYNKLTDIERQVVEWGVDLFVDIGDVEFVPNRERLSYTDRTIAGVMKYMADAINSIKEELEIQVANQPTMWTARRMLNDIKHSVLGKVRSLATVMYQGKEIGEYIKFHKVVADMGITRTITVGQDPNNPLNPMYAPNPEYPTCEIYTVKREKHNGRPEETIYCNGTRIYVNDLERGGIGRIKKHLEDNYTASAYVLTGVDKPEFYAATGIDEVMVRASTLPQPERKERQKREGVSGDYVKRTVLQEYNPNGGNYVTDWWRDVEVDVKDGGVFVVVSYGTITEGQTKTTPADIKRKYLAIKALRPDFKLYGIRPAHMGRIERYKHNWIKFDDYAESLLKEEYPKVEEKVKLWNQHLHVRHNDRYSKFFGVFFDAHSPFGNFIEKFHKVKEAQNDPIVQAVVSLNNAVANNFEITHTEENALRDEEDKLSNFYPLFDCLEWYRMGHHEFTNGLVDYIRGVDDLRAKTPAVKEAV